MKNFTMKADIKFPSKAEIKQSGTTQEKVIKAFTVASLRASGIVEQELPVILNQALESSVWGPFNPKAPYARKSGEIMGPGMRNIVDTGRLRDSVQVKTKFLKTKTQTIVTYSAPYASFVHNGGVIQPYGNKSAASVIIPARPWITATLTGNGPVPKYDYMSVYQKEVEASWNE